MRSILRRIFFIIIFSFTLGFTSLFAQDLTYSIGVGGNYSGVNYSNEKPFPEYVVWDKKEVYSYTASLNVNYNLSETFFLVSGLRFAQLGNEVETYYEIETPIASPLPTKFSIRQNYLYIPLKVGYKSKNILDFYLIGGLEIGYLFSAELNTDFDYGDSKNEDITAMLEKFNVCIGASIGHDFKLFSVTFLAEVGVSYGLTNVLKDQAIVGTFAENWKTPWSTKEIYLMLGVYL